MGTKSGVLVPPEIGKASFSAGITTGHWGPLWQSSMAGDTDGLPASLPVLSRVGDLQVTPRGAWRATWGSFPALSGDRDGLLWPPLPGHPHLASGHQRASGPAAPACFGGRLGDLIR